MHEGRVETEVMVTMPVFKFQKPQFANQMLATGSVHLSQISRFRDPTLGGLTHDPDEGRIWLHPEESLGEDSYTGKICTLDDALIFCSSGQFVSDTLKWALDEKNTACVLITDLNAVVERITNALDGFVLLGTRACEYRGRHICVRGAPDDQDEYAQMVQNLAAWSKPKKFSPQKEVRSVWLTEDRVECPRSKDVPADIAQFLIPVEYEGFEEFDPSSSQLMIRTEIITGEDHRNSMFRFRYPNDAHSPVIWKKEGAESHALGFFVPGDKLEIGVMMLSEGVYGMTEAFPGGWMVASIDLRLIERIRYVVIGADDLPNPAAF